MEGTMEKSENRVPPTIVESTLNSVYALFRYYYDFIIIFLNVLFLKGNPTIVNRGPIFNNKIVIIGDDIAAGVGDIDALLHIKGIASPLALQLRKNTRIKQTWRIYSCGVVGSTSEEWLPTSEKKNDKTTHFETVFNNPKYADAKIVIIFLGFNDERNGSLSADDTYENIVAISKVLTNMGKPVYICPVPTHADHLVSDELYGNNLRRNELLDLYTDNETRLVGESYGVGKSALAVQIAKQFKGHIINADSMQVYKGLDIITNKPDKKERESAPHHLFDFVHPLNEYSVADYVNDATAIVDKLHSQNILPVICGGTNHYTLSLLCNVNVFETSQESNENGHPSIDLELRKELQYVLNQTDSKSIKLDRINNFLQTYSIHQLLDKIDPKIAKRWHENDFRKIRRSLEVYYYTGKRYSELLEDNEQLKDSYEGLRYTTAASNRSDTEFVFFGCMDGMFTEMHDLREQMNENKTVSFDSQYNRGIFQSIAIESKFDKIEIEKLLENGIENMKVATRQYARHQVSQIKNKFVPVMIKEHNQNTGSFYLIDATGITLFI
ncbi:hypothetical protein HDV02_000159 [Globomyces sp. JEL0801]|nr:hypothetical protein HDV02_000159 [Globomyces sp. JEL0801]